MNCWYSVCENWEPVSTKSAITQNIPGNYSYVEMGLHSSINHLSLAGLFSIEKRRELLKKLNNGIVLAICCVNQECVKLEKRLKLKSLRQRGLLTIVHILISNLLNLNSRPKSRPNYTVNQKGTDLDKSNDFKCYTIQWLISLLLCLNPL